jgi:hypothetical protein
VTRPAPAVLVLLCLGSCYSVGGLYENRNVKVDVFDNITERRTEEFDLTSAVVHEMTARGLRVNGLDAPVTLTGKIVDMRTPTVVSGDLNAVVVGSLSIRLQIRLVTADGKDVWKDETTQSASFTSTRGQTFNSARAEAYDRLARWVVAHFEKEW